MYNPYYEALALIAGGWSSKDANEIKREYDFTDDEVLPIIHEMKKIEKDGVQFDR